MLDAIDSKTDEELLELASRLRDYPKGTRLTVEAELKGRALALPSPPVGVVMNPRPPVLSTLSGSTRAALVFWAAIAGAVLSDPASRSFWLLERSLGGLGDLILLAGILMLFALVATMTRRHFVDAETMSVWGFAFAATAGFCAGGSVSLLLGPSVLTAGAAATGAGAGAAVGSFLGPSVKNTMILLVIIAALVLLARVAG